MMAIGVEMKLVLGDEVIWENPEGLGHFGIKLRKQVYEDWLAKEVLKRSVRAGSVVKKVAEM